MRGIRRSLRGRQIGLGLAAGLGLAWGLGAARAPVANGGVPANEASSTIAFTSPVGGSSAAQLLYLIDTKSQAFAVYRIDPQTPNGAVKLEAARQYRWDMRLSEYNNQKPEVAAIEAMVGTGRQ